MKLLKTDDQHDLGLFLESLKDEVSSQIMKNQLDFWILELKPKRIRKKKDQTVYPEDSA